MSREPVDHLYMLAFDHRQVLRDLYGQVQEARFSEIKAVVADVLAEVVGPDLPARNLSLLMDEQFGAEAVRSAIAAGFYVAMPVEASRTSIFEIQYPDDYQHRFSSFAPACMKALVFNNPEDDQERKGIQTARIREVQDWAVGAGYDFLLEVLVEPTKDQLARVVGDAGAFRRDLLPELLVQTIGEYHEAGIEPDIWKIEGLESVDACRAVGDVATADSRDHVTCIVLGSGASVEDASRWLAHAGAVDSFSGFAIGRSVWHGPIGDFLSGQVDRAYAVARMADTFRTLVAAFGRSQEGATSRI